MASHPDARFGAENSDTETPDAYGVPTQDWLARGLSTPAGRGWSAGTPALSGAELNAKLAEHGVALRPPAGDKPWPTGWWPGDAPMEIVTEECDDPYAEARVFGRAARVRFLDALASHGNVRAAAARVGVSRETVYRARRRHADFARLWDAALVHARARAEAELADRALNGVAVPVMLRGEHVGTFRKHDARYLLAHLGRLDRRIEEDGAAVLRSERFEDMLAAMAGNAAPDGFDDIAQAMAEDYGVPADLPPTCEDYVAQARSDALCELEDDDDEDSVVEAAAQAARRTWRAWKAAGARLLDKVLSAPETRAAANPMDSVTCVNTPAAQTAGGAL